MTKSQPSGASAPSAPVCPHNSGPCSAPTQLLGKGPLCVPVPQLQAGLPTSHIPPHPRPILEGLISAIVPTSVPVLNVHNSLRVPCEDPPPPSWPCGLGVLSAPQSQDGPWDSGAGELVTCILRDWCRGRPGTRCEPPASRLGPLSKQVGGRVFPCHQEAGPCGHEADRAHRDAGCRRSRAPWPKQF